MRIFKNLNDQSGNDHCVFFIESPSIFKEKWTKEWHNKMFVVILFRMSTLLVIVLVSILSTFQTYPINLSTSKTNKRKKNTNTIMSPWRTQASFDIRCLFTQYKTINKLSLVLMKNWIYIGHKIGGRLVRGEKVIVFNILSFGTGNLRRG